MSKKVTVRFTPEEYQALQRIMLSNVRGDMTQSEIIRELVKREAERRFKLSLPSPWGEMRNGRPKKENFNAAQFDADLAEEDE